MNLRAQFSFYVSILVVLVVLGSGVMTVLSERRLLKDEIRQHNQQMIKLLARVGEESLYQNDFVLFNYFEKLKAERGFVAACFIDNNDVIQIHSDPQKIGQTFRSPDSAEQILDLAAPVFLASGRAGTAHLLLSQTEIQQFIHQSLVKTVKRMGIISGISLLLGLLGALWVARTLVNPIHRLVRGMKRVATGHLNPIRFPKRQDEIGWMGDELNETIKKLKELDEMKRDFVSSVTHELKSPLVAIESFISILMKRARTKGAIDDQDLLNTVKNNSTRLRKMIDDLLTTAKVEAGRLDLDCQLFDVRKAIRETVELYKPLSEEKGIPLRLDIPASPVQVWADHNKIVHILTNLISNALKFTEKGHILIGIRPEEEGVSLFVADTGPGISPQDRARIFEKFYQGPTGSQKRRGTGLGLTIVKGLVESHGGRISVSPENGGGTRFTFTIPSQKA